MPSRSLMQEENCWTTVRIISCRENSPGLKLHLLLLEVVKLGLRAPVRGVLSLTKRLCAERLQLGCRDAGDQRTTYLKGAAGSYHVSCVRDDWMVLIATFCLKTKMEPKSKYTALMESNFGRGEGKASIPAKSEEDACEMQAASVIPCLD